MPHRSTFALVLGAAAAALVPSNSFAQDRLKSMPGYERFQQVGKKIAGSFKSGALTVTWRDEGAAFEFKKDGKLFRFDCATREATEIEKPKAEAKSDAGPRGPRGPRPERGRQFESAPSPDGKLLASCRGRNLWIAHADGSAERAITSDGSALKRIKNATASWVYGEELDQVTAMWWSPDSSRIAFYRFDESLVRDYYLALDQVEFQSTLDVEAYPKAGAANPVAEIFVHDLSNGSTTRLDVRDGQPFEDATVGHYVYGVEWTKDGRELLFHRTNRLQNVMELCAADPASGKCRVVLREEWPASWTENSPSMTWLEDGRRFLWVSERTGWRNYYLYDLSGKLLAPVTQHEFEVANIVRVDEAAGQLWYMARSGDNPMKQQLHRVGLDGRGDVRLTDPGFHHTVDLAPDGRHFLDTYQTHDTPPAARLVDAQGAIVKELSQSDLVEYEKLGLKRVELLTFKAGDGATDLYGLLHFPSDFDPARKYPLLVNVYAGPATNGARETFSTPSSLTEYGFLVASFDSRSAAGRGKRFLDAIYGKLGTVEIDDQAAGVRSLWERPYVDRERVGIQGTSYGGYASALCLLRHPDVFRAACASSAVTDWRHYDTIYTERYMGTPQDNAAGYDAGSATKLAGSLKGRLMLFWGTADNNVHPANSLQLVQALQRAGKSFELQVGPDQGHSGLSNERMMEFFIENLVLAEPAAAAR